MWYILVIKIAAHKSPLNHVQSFVKSTTNNQNISSSYRVAGFGKLSFAYLVRVDYGAISRCYAFALNQLS